MRRILKTPASLTAHWHDKGADWRGLAHTQAHHRSRLSDSVKNVKEKDCDDGPLKGPLGLYY